ncbi:MAG: OmpA family protein [Nitrospira sp.]|nr:OmpA family protein [Nitrospira sp.]
MAQSRNDGTTPGEQDYAELRSLLLAPEQTRLEQLREQVEHIDLNAQNLSRVLPDAIALRGEGDHQLTHVLTPHVSEALGTSVRRQPHLIVDAIAPIMMPAIRQAIANALRSMVQSLNQTIEHSLSIQSLKWRVEALRTGKPFAEIVLLHTLRYRVEQVFLIHSQTGLLLAHAAGDSVAVQDQTLVSGMLSAIRSFVQDSFGAAPDQVLNTLQVGELTVWIEQGPAAILAAVIRGTPPENLRLHLQDILTRIHADRSEALARFTGDAATFASVTPLLEECLRAQFESRRRGIALMTWALMVVALLFTAWWGLSSYQERQRWQTYLSHLAAEPGLVVTNAESEGRRYRLTGLRDPLAADPAALLQDSGMDASRVESKWQAYYALDPTFILKRAGFVLSPPQTVQLSLEGSRLTAGGTAPADWIRHSRTVARALPGLDGYDDRRLVSCSLDVLRQQLIETSILFEQGRSNLASPDQLQDVRRIAELLRQLDDMARLAGAAVSVSIVGQTDIVGGPSLNRRLSESRARAVLDAIHPASFQALTFQARGMTPETELQRATPAVAHPQHRRASLDVTIQAVP